MQGCVGCSLRKSIGHERVRPDNRPVHCLPSWASCQEEKASFKNFCIKEPYWLREVLVEGRKIFSFGGGEGESLVENNNKTQQKHQFQQMTLLFV